MNETFFFPENGKLTPQMCQHYETYGFIVLEKFLSGQDYQGLLSEVAILIEGVDLAVAKPVFFTTDDENNVRNRDQYFVESASHVWPFFETGAFEDGKLVVEKSQAINKFGHAVGEHIDGFKRITFKPEIANIAKGLGLQDPRLTQSMIILKPAKIGGYVVPHQDATYIHTQPHNELGYWLPLVDVTTENACLWVIPGSHRYPLIAHYIKEEGADNFNFVDPQTKSMFTLREMLDKVDKEWPQDRFVPVEMKAGSLLVFHSHLVHKSEANTSNKDRPAYAFHVADGQAKWDKRNWLQREEFPRLGLDAQ